VLPCASEAAQLEVVRSALSAAGVERRKRVVKWCCEVLGHLDLVPEAMLLRSKLEAFVDGTDPEHFGDVLAELLNAWASSSSPEMVEHAVAVHHAGLEAIMKQTFKALHKCKGEWKGKGRGKCGWWKGKGKGWGSSFDCEGDGGMRKGDFWKSKGDWWKAKAASKGKCAEKWAEHTLGRTGSTCFGPVSDPLTFKGALAGMLAQKGLGKGFGFSGGWPPSATAEKRPGSTPAAAQVPTSDGAAPAPTCCLAGEQVPISVAAVVAAEPRECRAEDEAAPPVIPTPSAPPAPPEEDLTSKVQLLLEMGLVSDPCAGLDLLRAQGGDLMQVAAMLVG